MVPRAMPRRTVFGMVIEDLRTASGIDHLDLAHAMNANGILPITSASLSDAELAKRLRALEFAALDDTWPLSCTEVEFITCFAQSIPSKVIVVERLQWALLLDDCARLGC